MPATKIPNPFSKTSQAAQYSMFQSLKGGRSVSVDEMSEKFGHRLSNRSIGVFLRLAEDAGMRFTRTTVPSKGIVYRMNDDTSLPRISVPYQNYLANGKVVPERVAKKAAKSMSSKAAPKTTTKAAPAKASATKAKSVPKATPKVASKAKPMLKKKGAVAKAPTTKKKLSRG